MIYGSRGHFFRSRILRIFLFVVLAWAFLEALYIHRTLIAAESRRPGRTNTEKIFICALPWNNEIILRTHLINQIRDLVHALGEDNVYISIFENGSFDGTKPALQDLQRELEQMGVRNKIILDDVSHQDIVNQKPQEPQPGWIKVEDPGFERFQIHQGDYALRRIYYLATLRNKALEPLVELAEHGETFDKVLFLNDVVFTADDVLELLHTKDGQYAAACTLDFSRPPAFYDTFALRDSDGRPAIMYTWPYFRSSASRDAMIANQPVPVQSCWNGLVAMPAAPFYDRTDPLRFRAIPDTLAHKHVEGSECCLIHSDNALSNDLGVWLNPAVRVGYCHPDKSKFTPDWDGFKRACQAPYDELHPHSGAWVSYPQVVKGIWANRIRRWFSAGWMQDWKARRALRAWESEAEGNLEVGEVCLINEMQIIEPHGWIHI